MIKTDQEIDMRTSNVETDQRETDRDQKDITEILSLDQGDIETNLIPDLKDINENLVQNPSDMKDPGEITIRGDRREKERIIQGRIMKDHPRITFMGTIIFQIFDQN